jgi:hypothetical protein
VSGTAQQLGIGQPDPSSALGVGPSLADAWTFNAKAAGDFIQRKRAEAEQQGLWANGMPTPKGAAEAGGRIAGALVAGTGEKGAKPEGFDEAVHAWRRGELPSIFDSPDYKRYRTDLDAHRSLWGQAEYHRNVLRDIQTRANEPNLTDEGKARLQRQLQRVLGGLQGAKQGAAFFGHDVEGPFPTDEWLHAELPPAEGPTPPGGRLRDVLNNRAGRLTPGMPPLSVPEPATPPEVFEVYNHRTGQVVGRASTLKRARSIVDKRDNEYGGYAHSIRRPGDPPPKPRGQQ